jgi:hypothetical protein
MVISARSRKNYIEFGRTIPADSIEFPCSMCGDTLMLSKEASEKLEKARGDAKFSHVGALCTPCTIVSMEIVGKVEEFNVELSKQASDMVEDREEGKVFLQYLLDKATKSRG